MATKPLWAEWAKTWPVVYPKIGPFRDVRERIISALNVLNAVRTKPSPFEEPESEIDENNWALLLEELYFLLRPCPPEPAALKRLVERARKRRKPNAEIKFDVPALYGAQPNGTPTQLSAFRLIATLHWTLASLCEEMRDRPRIVSSFADEHFSRLRVGPQILRVTWRYRSDPQTGESLKPAYPELIIAPAGVDSLAWVTLLDFFKSAYNWRDLIGKCPQCLRLFEKPRTDAKYCSNTCSDKARYERWKERGGLKARKRRRLKV